MAKQIYRLAGDQQSPNYRNFTSAWRTDGVNDYGAFTSGTFAPANAFSKLWRNKPFSFCFWIKNLASSIVWAIDSPSFFAQTGINDSLSFWLGANYCGIYTNSSGSISISTTLPTGGKWNHVAITYDGSNNSSGFKIYINSSDSDDFGTSSRTNTLISLPNLVYQTNYVSRHPNSVTYYANDMVDFRIFEKVLSSEFIRKLYHQGYQLIEGSELVRLPMTTSTHFENNVPSGQCRALDLSGNSNHLAIFGQGTSPTLNSFY